jgi:hypothetical protein
MTSLIRLMAALLALAAPSLASAQSSFLRSDGTFAQLGLSDLPSGVPAGAIFDVKNSYSSNIANALSAANAAGGGILYFAPNTTYTVSGATTLGNNISVLCGNNATIQTSSATADIFDVTGTGVVISGCNFGTTVIRTAGSYINATGPNTRIENVQMYDPYIGLLGNSAVWSIRDSYMFGVNSIGVECKSAGGGHIIGSTIQGGWGFSGYISTTTLTVTTANNVHALAVGMAIGGAGVTNGTYITALGSGSGGLGTYTVNNSQTVGSVGSPSPLTAYGAGKMVDVIGDGAAYGCAMTIADSDLLNGYYSLVVESPNGGTSFVFVSNTYLDNASVNAVAISPASGGSVPYVKVKNSEIGVYSSSSAAVNIAAAVGSSMGYVNLSGNSIYSYATNSSNGINIGTSSPSGLVIQGNDIGLQGGTFASGIASTLSGNLNAIMTGNNVKGSSFPLYMQNTSDSTCIFSLNKMNGGSPNNASPCHQTNNY